MNFVRFFSDFDYLVKAIWTQRWKNVQIYTKTVIYPSENKSDLFYDTFVLILLSGFSLSQYRHIMSLELYFCCGQDYLLNTDQVDTCKILKLHIFPMPQHPQKQAKHLTQVTKETSVVRLVPATSSPSCSPLIVN